MFRILALDDSNVIRSLVKLTLNNTEVIVDSASSAHQAFAFSAQHHYHLFIIDYMMPEVNGLEFIHQLRDLVEYQDTPIIMLTAESSDEIKAEAKALKVTAWVTKPFQPQTLIKLTHKILTQTYPAEVAPKANTEEPSR